MKKAWSRFEKTGDIKEYLRYRELLRRSEEEKKRSD